MPSAPLRFPSTLEPDGATVRRGLVVLAALISDTLGSLASAMQPVGLRPALVSGEAGGPARPSWHASIGTPATRPAVSRSSSPRPSPGDAPSGEPDNGTVDAEHVEIWEIVGRAQTGDGEAFGILYDRYVDLVFRFIYYRVSDRALAEDFTSETFLRALRRIGSISYQGRDIGAWFVTIARNIVLDHMKSARNRLETTTGETIESREHERSTEAAVLDTLQSERLMEAVNQLGDEQRECIMLRFIQGLSVSETAEVMGKNDGAIKALQHRAVRKLADIVGGELR